MAPRAKRSNGSSKKPLRTEKPTTKKTKKKTIDAYSKHEDSNTFSNNGAAANTTVIQQIDIKAYINASKKLPPIKARSAWGGAVPERFRDDDEPSELTVLLPELSVDQSSLVDKLWATKSESQQIIRGDLTVSDLVLLFGTTTGNCEGNQLTGATISAYLSLVATSVKKFLKIAIVPHKVVEMLDQRGAAAANALLGKMDLLGYDIVAIPIKYRAGFQGEREQWMLMWCVVSETTIHHVNSDCRRKYDDWPGIEATLTKTAENILKANAVHCGRVFADDKWTACMDKHVSPDQLYEFNSGLSVLVDATLLANGVSLIYSSCTANLVPLRRLITYRLLKNTLY